jgi:hypothetical protein
LKWARFARTLTRLSVIKKFTHDPINVGFLVGEVGGGSVFVSDDSPASNANDEGIASVVVSSTSGRSANNFDGTCIIVSGHNSRSDTIDEGNPRAADTDRGKGAGNNVGGIGVADVECPNDAPHAT